MSKVDNSVFDDPRFMLLVRQGLIDKGQIATYKRAVKKVEDGKLPTSKELRLLNDLITKLAGFTTSDNTTYQKARKMAKEDTFMRTSNDWENIVELTNEILEKQGPCWDGYKKVKGKKDYEQDSCAKEDVAALALEAYLDEMEFPLDEAGFMDPPRTREEFEKRFPTLNYEDFLSFVESAEELEMAEQKNYHPGYDPNNKYTHHLFLAKPPKKVPEPSAAEKARRAKVSSDIKKNQAHHDAKHADKAAWLAKHSKNNESVEAEIEERTDNRYSDVEKVKIHKRQKEKRVNRKPAMLARDADNPNLKAKRNKLAKIKNLIPDDPKQEESFTYNMDALLEAAGDSYPLAESLKDLLSDSFQLYFKAQSFHWNVEGENFNDLHELFGAVYTDTYESIDVIAEQLRTLDEKAPVSMKEIIDRSIIEDEVPSNPTTMLYALEEMNADLIESLYVTHKIGQRENNLAITSYVEERIQKHEKHGWKLRSSYPDESIAESTNVYANYIGKTILK